MSELKQKDIVYYARIIPTSSVYEVCELIIRTVEDTWFVGIDKRDKHKSALDKVLYAEANKKDVSNEVYYEEF